MSMTTPSKYVCMQDVTKIHWHIFKLTLSCSFSVKKSGPLNGLNKDTETCGSSTQSALKHQSL